MSVNEAVGIDLAPDKILKFVLNDASALKQLIFIINSYLAQKKLPKSWTTGRLILFNKTTETHPKLSNLRPIMIQSCFLKLIERMIY